MYLPDSLSIDPSVRNASTVWNLQTRRMDPDDSPQSFKAAVSLEAREKATVRGGRVACLAGGNG